MIIFAITLKVYVHVIMLFIEYQQEQKERRRKLHTEHGMWQGEMEERRAEDKRRRLELRCGKFTRNLLAVYWRQIITL